MALGRALREAREKAKKSPSQVAAATRMKVQIVEALENEDFDSIAAPIYAKGFIKLYAEHVGLDPAPLVREYEEQVAGTKARPAKADSTPAGEPATPAAEGDKDLFSRVEKSPPQEEDNAPPAAPRTNLHPALRTVMSTASGLAEELRTKSRDRWRQAAQQGSRWAAHLASAWARHRSDFPRITLAQSPWKAALLMVGALVVLLFIISGLSQCVRKARPAADDVGREALHLAVDPPDTYLE